MGERLYRTQILLEPEQHRSLSKIARQQARSVSDVVREIIREYLAEQDDKMRIGLEALEQIERDYQRILDSRGGKPLDIDITEIINQAREERANELLRNILDRS